MLVVLLLVSVPLGSPRAAGTVAGADSQEVEDFLAAWAASFEDIRTLRVRFKQTKTLRILKRPRVSQGVALLKGRRLVMRIWDSSGSKETELLVAPEEVRLHYPRLKRLEVYPAGGQPAGATPFPLFGSEIEALPETYELELRGEGDAKILIMVPRARSAEVEEVRMRFAKGQIVAVQQRNSRGDTVHMKLTEFTRNPDISDDDLELEVPSDTKVVHVLAPPSEKKPR